MAETRPPEPLLRAWSETALLSRAGMEMTWVALWYAAAFERQVRIPWWGIWLALCGVTAGSYGLARLFNWARWPLRLRRGLFLLWIALCAFGTLKLILLRDVRTDLPYLLLAPVRSLTGADDSLLPFLHILFIPLLALRGVLLAGSPPDVRGSLLGLQTGLVALLLHGLIYLPTHPRMSAGGLFLFLFLGLVMMCAARIAGVTNFRGGRLARPSVGWAAGVLAGALAVVGAGLLLGRISAGSAGEIIAAVFLGILGLLGILLLMVFFPLLSWLVNLVILALQRLAGGFDTEFFENIKKGLAGFQTLAAGFFERILPALHMARILIPLLVLLGVVGLALLWLKLSELRLNARAEEETAQAPPADLLALLRRLARRLRPWGRRAAHPGRILAAARIRRVYGALMARCAGLGAPRKPWLTPLEFLPQARELFPGREAELELITSAYVRVRYGELPETRQEVSAVLEAWRKIKQ